jgi:hypothetical protein
MESKPLAYRPSEPGTFDLAKVGNMAYSTSTSEDCSYCTLLLEIQSLAKEETSTYRAEGSNLANSCAFSLACKGFG